MKLRRQEVLREALAAFGERASRTRKDVDQRENGVGMLVSSNRREALRGNFPLAAAFDSIQV